jgi:hypothetical protein
MHEEWQLFLDLFDSKESAEVLSYVAHRPFKVLHEAVGNDMAMAICRLSDPIQSCGDDNLSMAALVQPLGHIEGFAALVKEFQEECKPVLRHRHKKIAHKDRATALNPKDHPIPGVEHSRIERILELASSILNAVIRSTGARELGFRPLKSPFGSAKDIVKSLKIAKEINEQRRQLALFQ